MKREDTIGFNIRSIDNMLMRKAMAMSDEESGKNGMMPVMQGWIMGYLYDHKEEEIFQRDIEAQKNREAIMKMQEAEKKQGIPYASPQVDIRQFQVPSLEKLFGNVTQNLIVTVDGVRERNVSVMSSIT